MQIEMGKLGKPPKTKERLVKKSHTIKKTGIVKPASTVPFKRLIMLQRRINSLLSEQHLWEEKNKQLLESLKTEKMLSASLKKESFHWQRVYHESTITINTYKVKQAEMTQAMSACLREIDSIYPHMVAFSESVTSNKIRISNMLASLPTSEYDCLPTQFRDTSKINDETNKIKDKPTKHRVGPMVRGLLITKPKIMLERLMLPQPQDQEPVNNVSEIQVKNPLTPIPEENDHEEDVRLQHVSIRPKRKLGRSWRLRRQDKIVKERERKNKPSAAVAYDGDSSDTESNPAAINHMEPVVRFKDVSRLLQNSSLLKVDNGRNGDKELEVDSTRQSEIDTCHLPVNVMKRTAEDPLEGSSWMFNNSHKHCGSYRPANLHGRSSLYKSDSSEDCDDDGDYDEENLVVVQSNTSNLSSLDSLGMKTHIYTCDSKVRNSLFSADTSHDTLDGSPTAEPDSTNNIDVQNLNSCSFKDLSENINKSSSTLTSANKSVVDSSNTTVQHNSTNAGQTDLVTVQVGNSVSKVPDERSSLSNGVCSPVPSTRHSSCCNNCSPAQTPPECLGKRMRKPKTQLYPGEEDFIPTSKTASYKTITIRKTEKKRTKSTNVQKRSSTGRVSNCTIDDTRGSDTKITKKKKTSGKGIERDSLYKKSSLKRSTNTHRISSTDGWLSDSGESSRPRRNHANVCYKEPSLNMKHRRP